MIYDRNGVLLAGNTTVYEVGVDLTALAPTKTHTTLDMERNIALAAQMALGMDPATALEKMTNVSRGYPIHGPGRLCFSG